MSIKILHVLASLDPSHGGVTQAVRTIVHGLADLGVHNEVVCLDAVDSPYLVGDMGVVHPMGPRQGPWAYNPRLIPWLAENLSGFDAVVLHGLWLFPGFALRKALQRVAKRKRFSGSLPKVFVMPHGMLDPYFQKAPDRRFKAWRNWVFWKIIEKKVVNEADGIFFTCEEERNLAKITFRPYQPKHEIVVGLGVEKPPVFTLSMEAAFLEKCPQLQNRTFLLFLSRIHEKKGVDLLIRSYATLMAKLSANKSSLAGEVLNKNTNLCKSKSKEDEPPVLIIAGPGLDSAFGLKVQALVADNPSLKGRIHFPGMLSGDEKWGAFYGCEAFVLPSHQENFGIAVVEALACGKPVLISNQINIWRELINANGGLVAPDTEQGTLELLESWNCLPREEKSVMRENALKAYIEHFAIVPNTHRIFQALQNL